MSDETKKVLALLKELCILSNRAKTDSEAYSYELHTWSEAKFKELELLGFKNTLDPEFISSPEFYYFIFNYTIVEKIYFILNS